MGIAKLNFHGIEISVPVSELGEAMRQLLSAKPPVPGAGAVQEAGTRKASSSQLDVFPDAGADARSQAINFLRAVGDATESGGVRIAEVMALIGASHPKGVGSKMALVNKEISESGFDIASVYTNERDPMGIRLWRAGPKLQEALSMLEDEPLA